MPMKKSNAVLLPELPKGNQKEFLDTDELLALLPISIRTLRLWRKQEVIPFRKIGRRVIFHYPSVRASLLKMQTGGAQ